MSVVFPGRNIDRVKIDTKLLWALLFCHFGGFFVICQLGNEPDRDVIQPDSGGNTVLGVKHQPDMNLTKNVLLWVRSIGKSGFRFWISDFGFPNKTRNPKTDFDEPKSFSRTDFN